MEVKEQLLLSEEFQLINVEKMKEIEKSPLEHSRNNCQARSAQMPKLVGKSLRRK